MTWCLGKAPTLATQAVLFSLAHHADHWGITYIGQATVASECSCRVATVSTNLKKLEEAGLVARVQRRDIGGRRTSDHVVLAPLAEDRGGMANADKLAREKHPNEVCDLAQSQLALGASRDRTSDTPDGNQLTPDGQPTYARRTRTDRELKEELKEERAGEEELVPDPVAIALKAWIVKGLTDQRGGIPPRVTKDWGRAARELAPKPRAEFKAVVGWAWANPYWFKRTNTLPKLAQQYPELRAEWFAAQQQARSRPQRRDEPREVPKARHVSYT